MYVPDDLEYEAMFGDGQSFITLAEDLLIDAEEYQRMAERAAIEGNASVIQSISEVCDLDYSSIGHIARSYGHYDLAIQLTGVDIIPDIDYQVDIEDDLGNIEWEES